MGNGFDIAHGLDTKYSDFMQYLQSFEKEPEYIMGNFVYSHSITPHDQEKHRFFEAIRKYIPQDDLWNSFEDALGILDDEQVQEDNSCYYMDYGDDNWRDSANHDYQYMIDEDLSFASDIPQYFSEWITKINTNVLPIVSSQILDRNCLFLNFNYTDTVERAYGIPTNRILYVHGNALRGDNLILGHHDDTLFQEKPMPVFNSEEEWEMYRDSQDEDFRVQEAKKIIKSYFKRTYKDTALIVQQNHSFFEALVPTDEIYVLGHSLSLIDFNYFIEIARFVSPTCKWYISYYSQDDFCKAQDFAKVLGLQSYQLITFEEIK
ncbi:bacteriophage abortive infection AbiH family protein [Clostridium sp. CTA-5]